MMRKLSCLVSEFMPMVVGEVLILIVVVCEHYTNPPYLADFVRRYKQQKKVPAKFLVMAPHPRLCD
jgi:hypothetical protein